MTGGNIGSSWDARPFSTRCANPVLLRPPYSRSPRPSPREGILYGLLEAGKKVPGDISLVGFGNIRAQLFLPPLTCVSQELRLIGQRAVQLALQRWDGTEFPPGHIERIPSAFVERASTGPARRS